MLVIRYSLSLAYLFLPLFFCVKTRDQILLQMRANIEPSNVRKRAGPDIVCCQATTAECLSCVRGISIKQYCEEGNNSGTAGCEEKATDANSDRLCCSALTAHCLACNGGVSVDEFCSSPDHADIPGCSGGMIEVETSICCKSLTATCLSCSRGVTIMEFCADEENARVSGCEDSPKKSSDVKLNQICCRGHTAKCLACEAGVSLKDFCSEPKHADVVGCKALPGMVQESIDEKPKEVDNSLCCTALTAVCQSCSKGMSIEDYCRDLSNVDTEGCEDFAGRGPNPDVMCCQAATATCNACRAGVSVEKFCGDSKNADIDGC